MWILEVWLDLQISVVIACKLSIILSGRPSSLSKLGQEESDVGSMMSLSRSASHSAKGVGRLIVGGGFEEDMAVFLCVCASAAEVGRVMGCVCTYMFNPDRFDFNV